MFGIITKKDYWSYLDSGAMKPITARLKDIQDAFILCQLQGMRGNRILELGGGNSRILPILAKNNNECWNVDKFEGKGAGPSEAQKQQGVKVIKDYMGNFSKEIPDEAFDYVVSVSAVEHIPSEAFADSIKDCYRVLKTGGIMFHAIDLYLLDPGIDHPHASATEERLKLYLSVPEIVDGRFAWLSPPGDRPVCTGECSIRSKPL